MRLDVFVHGQNLRQTLRIVARASLYKGNSLTLSGPLVVRNVQIAIKLGTTKMRVYQNFARPDENPESMSSTMTDDSLMPDSMSEITA